MPRGVVIDIFAALARTKGDIHYPSDKSLDGHSSRDTGNSLFHFLGMPLYVAGNNKQSQKTVCTESR